MAATKKKKNAAAVALGQRGLLALAKKYTPEERSAITRKAAEKRWRDHQYSETASARSHRKARARERGE